MDLIWNHEQVGHCSSWLSFSLVAVQFIFIQLLSWNKQSRNRFGWLIRKSSLVTSLVGVHPSITCPDQGQTDYISFWDFFPMLLSFCACEIQWNVWILLIILDSEMLKPFFEGKHLKIWQEALHRTLQVRICFHAGSTLYIWGKKISTTRCLQRTLRLSGPALFSMMSLLCLLQPHSLSSTQTPASRPELQEKHKNLLPASHEDSASSSCDIDERLRPDGL